MLLGFCSRAARGFLGAEKCLLCASFLGLPVCLWPWYPTHLSRAFRLLSDGNARGRPAAHSSANNPAAG